MRLNTNSWSSIRAYFFFSLILDLFCLSIYSLLYVLSWTFIDRSFLFLCIRAPKSIFTKHIYENDSISKPYIFIPFYFWWYYKKHTHTYIFTKTMCNLIILVLYSHLVDFFFFFSFFSLLFFFIGVSRYKSVNMVIVYHLSPWLFSVILFLQEPKHHTSKCIPKDCSWLFSQFVRTKFYLLSLNSE